MGLEKQSYRLWVQWEEKIISFHKEDGFEEIRFANRDELLQYAAEKSNSGYSIQ